MDLVYQRGNIKSIGNLCEIDQNFGLFFEPGAVFGLLGQSK